MIQDNFSISSLINTISLHMYKAMNSTSMIGKLDQTRKD